jgi:hypothetical protein
MPAINPVRLKIQVTELVELSADPEQFLGALHSLLDFYADRSRRPGKSGRKASILRAYHAPRQVLKQIEKELVSIAASDFEIILTLIDVLWQEPWLECRLIAISLLECIPPKPPAPGFARLREWGKDCREEQLRTALLEVGVSRLRVETPDQFLNLVETWLTSADFASRKLGLRAIALLPQEQDFENLPLLYRLIAPLVREPDSRLEQDLLDVVSALARRSPNETLYFIRQNLSASRHPGLAWLARNTIKSFPVEQQSVLRSLLRERM